MRDNFNMLYKNINGEFGVKTLHTHSRHQRLTYLVKRALYHPFNTILNEMAIFALPQFTKGELSISVK